MTLLDAIPGTRVIVHGVNASPARIDKLASLGILPGVELVVHQRKPVIVVESGETVLALERELAIFIEVALAADSVPEPHETPMVQP